MSGADTVKTAGMGRHLSMLAAWGLSFGYAVGWGAFVMPAHDAAQSRNVV